MSNIISQLQGLEPITTGTVVFFMFFMIWSLIWKGWALWRAARNSSAAWFVVLLIFNTVGILEIIYIFGFSGYGKEKKA